MVDAASQSFVSVLRRPDGLFAYQVRRAREFFIPIPNPKNADQPLNEIDPYVESLTPLHQSGQAKRGPLKAVLDSWRELGNVRRLDEVTLFHLLNILLHSLPDETAGKAPAPLAFPPEPPVFRPTAANPRAYKGTKDRPPKHRRPSPMDLRPHLSNYRDVNELLVKLAPFKDKAEQLLKKADILTHDLPDLTDPKGRVRDVYLAHLHHGQDGSLQSLPYLFRRGFLFWRRGEPWHCVERMLALYRTLNLEKRPPLRRCLEKFLADVPFNHALDWCDLLPVQPTERQTALAEILGESDLRWKECPRGMVDFAEQASDLAPDSYYRHRMAAFVRSARSGGDLEYLLGGMTLASEYSESHSFEEVPKGTNVKVPLDTIRALVDHAKADYLAIFLWEACAKLEGLAETLSEAPWTNLPPALVRGFVDLLTGSIYDDHLDEEVRQEKWASLRDQAPRIFSCVQSVPASFQDKALRHFKELARFWDHPTELSWALERYVQFLPRICTAGFLQSGHEERALAILTNFEDDTWEKILSSSDAVFHELEKACRRQNDGFLIAAGLNFLRRRSEALAIEGILNETRAILETAKIIGGLGGSVRVEALQAWVAHPLMGEDIGDLPAEELVSIVSRNLPRRLPDPIPKKLKEFAAGRVRLNPNQLARAKARSVDALTALRWKLLGSLCLARVSSSLNISSEDSKAEHAIRYYGNIDENRRALRKFLQAYSKGDKEYLHRHPLNRSWLARQKRLNQKVWLDGMTMTRNLADGSSVTLHIELDPLEALRLGTYVGSCTGVGGMCAYSAAAVVLDLNKHVVYARDGHGAVLARQLVAVSEDELLVCFEVYPGGVRGEIKKWFREFDLMLAGRLGIEIFNPDSEVKGSGHVDLLLSRDWWDDGAWNLKLSDESAS